MIYIEALGCGTPVIAGAGGPAAELMVDGITGLLVGNVEDPDAIAAAILRLTSDPALSHRLQRTGPMVARTYSELIVDRKEQEIYREVINDGQHV